MYTGIVVRGCVAMRILGLAVLAICCLAVPAACEPPNAQPGDIALSLSITPIGDVITALEPLLATVEFRNQKEHDVSLAICEQLTMSVEIRNKKGEVVAATSRPELADIVYSTWKFAPGETRTKSLVMSGLYEFGTPGDYMIYVRQLDLQQNPTVLAEATASVHVLPFSKIRLESRCEKLFGPMSKRVSVSPEDAPEVRSLCSVRHNVALPYLKWIAENYDAYLACQSLRRINTNESLAMLDELMQRTDRIGETARNARQESALSPTDFLWSLSYY